MKEELEKARQYDLFNKPIKKDWEKEWKDMPEFNHKNKKPNRQIIVSFKNLEDIKEFSKLINQTITPKTRSLWFPKVEIETLMDKRWVRINTVRIISK